MYCDNRMLIKGADIMHLKEWIGICCLTFGTLFTSLTAYAADEYDVMNFDGQVMTVEDPVMTEIVNNIIKSDGQDVADAYLEAVASGDYSEFYEITGDTTETGRREAYVTIDGKIQTDSFLTEAQTIETWMQTLMGPEFTVQEVGQVLQDNGYAMSSSGAQNYFVDIMLGNATRPDNANPVYRLSEINQYIERQEDITWVNQGVLVEYESNPLTEMQKKIAQQYGLEIKSASEVYADDASTKEVSIEIATEAVSVDTEPVAVKTTPAAEDTNLTAQQFILIVVLVLVAGVIAGIILAIYTGRQPKNKKERK